ncbi:MAG: alpha/beta hydrolase [Clostridiaceae bacterium]|nr:alpha/beta hydrolase [Clostridiaceae bacterium]
MNLIPESNGLKKIKMKEKFTLKQWGKSVFFVICSIFLFGFLFQNISNFIGDQKIKQRLNYAKVSDNRMEYSYKGSGDYTIVFDGALGANLYEWNEVVKKVQKELDVKTFVYNRSGYGFNEAGNSKSPAKQAEDLKILLRKAGVTGNIILVGEEYGSLVMTNFAKLYPESVKGLMLIKPYYEEYIKSDEFRKNIKGKYLRSKVEKIGSYIGFTYLLDKLDLDIEVNDFEANLPEGADEEFAIQKNKSAYRTAINNELSNLINYDEDSQVSGLVSGKPLYIISNDENDKLAKLGDENLTTVYKTDSESTLISCTDSNCVVNGINNIIKEAKKIAKRENN